jgi:hypothetical protein
MRNRIPEVAEAAMIEDFYRGSNDSAFVRTILQKAPTTSEQLFREADLHITADERAQDLIGGVKSTPVAPRRDTNQQPNKWTCATPFGTAETSSTPSGTTDPSSLYLLLRHEEDRENRDNPSNRRREEVEPSRVSTERSMSSSADTDRRRTRDNKSSTIARYWWQLPALPPHTDGWSTRSPSLGRISGSTLNTQANTRSSSIRLSERAG